jgi:hypothetical protein
MSWLRRGRAQEGAYFRQEADFAAAKLRRELKEKGLLVESTPSRKAAWEEGASEVLPEILQVSLTSLWHSLCTSLALKSRSVTFEAGRS